MVLALIELRFLITAKGGNCEIKLLGPLRPTPGLGAAANRFVPASSFEGHMELYFSETASYNNGSFFNCLASYNDLV